MKEGNAQHKRSLFFEKRKTLFTREGLENGYYFYAEVRGVYRRASDKLETQGYTNISAEEKSVN